MSAHERRVGQRFHGRRLLRLARAHDCDRLAERLGELGYVIFQRVGRFLCEASSWDLLERGRHIAGFDRARKRRGLRVGNDVSRRCAGDKVVA